MVLPGLHEIELILMGVRDAWYGPGEGIGAWKWHRIVTTVCCAEDSDAIELYLGSVAFLARI
jgi:hypothetical protein